MRGRVKPNGEVPVKDNAGKSGRDKFLNERGSKSAPNSKDKKIRMEAMLLVLEKNKSLVFSKRILQCQI